MPGGDATDTRFQVPLGLRLFATLGRRIDGLLIAAGDLESTLLGRHCEAIAIDRPIYVAGLARSGSTILLEVLASAAGVTTHRYCDYPPLFVPYWWNRYLALLPRRQMPPAERTHRDGLAVTPDSPEAFEEAIWMAFFSDLHRAGASGVLDGNTNNPEFETFYRAHIRKLLAVRGARRYTAKGNYNATRLGYLAKLFPDARFVLPVREPAAHIASLMKQHALFSQGERGNPAMLAHLRRIGHFEFGLDRRPSNAGDADAVAEVAALWRDGQELRGWARYWARAYGFLQQTLARDESIRKAALVLRYEDLCDRPEATVRALAAHCGLDDADSLAARWAGRLHYPSYYRPAFAPDERAVIAEETAAVATEYGYRPVSE